MENKNERKETMVENNCNKQTRFGNCRRATVRALWLCLLLSVVIAGGNTSSFGQVADPYILAAGDISCAPDQRGVLPCKDQETANLINNLFSTQPGGAGVLALGDLQYEMGELINFQTQYHPRWGQFASSTFPAVGNHEYRTPGAAGYFDYWDSIQPGRAGVRGKGWYVLNIGTWRVYVINSVCKSAETDAGVWCNDGSEQDTWLHNDMVNTRQSTLGKCSLMIMHHALWTSGNDVSNTPKVKALMDEFYYHGGDVALAGHSHSYERFGRSDANQNLVYDTSAKSFRLFVVGTGGKNHAGGFQNPVEPNSRVRDNTTFGILKLRLGVGNYGWHFYAAPGTGTFDDRGEETCRPN